jgi:2-keto-3-deoxy-galactonokinase
MEIEPRLMNDRSNDGITVELYMIPGTTTSYVEVTDDRKEEFFTVTVPSPELAGEVFKHPYSYREMQQNAGQTALGANIELGQE